MKHLFVINPVSGNSAPTDALTAAVTRLAYEMNLDYDLVFTEYAGHAVKLVSNALCSGGEWRVYACGGDGTLNEVVCGAAGHDNAAVAHYPRGTGNDFIKCFPERDFSDIRGLISGETADVGYVDLGGGRYAVNICSVGIDANVAADVKTYKWAVSMGGKMPYNLSLLTNVIKGVSRHYDIEVDGEKFLGSYTLIAACNGQVYGGGFRACPDADPTDDNLEFLLIKKVSRLTIAKVVGTYAAGEYKKLPHIVRRITGKQMRIRSEVPVNINYDGEIYKSDDVTIKLSPSKMKFVLPRKEGVISGSIPVAVHNDSRAGV